VGQGDVRDHVALGAAGQAPEHLGREASKQEVVSDERLDEAGRRPVDKVVVGPAIGIAGDEVDVPFGVDRTRPQKGLDRIARIEESGAPGERVAPFGDQMELRLPAGRPGDSVQDENGGVGTGCGPHDGLLLGGAAGARASQRSPLYVTHGARHRSLTTRIASPDLQISARKRKPRARRSCGRTPITRRYAPAPASRR
jgi:hypothetical protein